MNFARTHKELEILENELKILKRDHKIDVELRRLKSLISRTAMRGGLGHTLEESCKRGYELITKRRLNRM